MKMILDIQDSKAAEFVAMLKEFTFVKAKELSDTDSDLLTELEEIKTAIRHAGFLKESKLESRPVEDLLNEL